MRIIRDRDGAEWRVTRYYADRDCYAIERAGFCSAAREVTGEELWCGEWRDWR